MSLTGPQPALSTREPHHVAGPSVGLHVQVVNARQASLEEFFEGMPFDPLKPPKWVDWEDFCVLNERLELLCGGPMELAEIGEQVFDASAFGGIGKAMGLGISPRTLFWASHHWAGPKQFPNIDKTYEELPDGRLRLGMSVPEGSSGNTQFFVLISGMFRALPRLLGLPDAVVDATITAREATFLITVPPSRGLWQRLRRAWAVLRGGGLGGNDPSLATFKQLTEQNLEFKEQRRVALEAQQAAEHASRVKSDFLATMSHELRTPLNGVIGMSSLLLEREELTPRVRASVETIDVCAQSLLTLISDVLDLARLEAGKLSLDAAPYEPQTLVESSLDIVSANAHGKGIELLGEVAPDVPPRVNGEESRLRQVVTNLLANAVKFTTEGEVQLLVSRALESDRALLRFEVRDTGSGIPIELQESLFLPFNQGDNSITRRHGGTGLGLAISRQLVRAMGGEIGVESVPGEGSTFWFTVPLVADVRVPSTGHARSRAELGVGDFVALVVDDNASALRSHGGRLAALGVEAELTSDISGALASIAQRPPHVLLVDQRLGAEDGLELVRKVRAMPDFARLPVLLMMDRVNAAEQEVVEELSVDAIIRKPVHPGALRNAMVELLRPLGGEGGSAPTDAAPIGSMQAPSQRAIRVMVADDNPVNRMVTGHMLGSMVDVVKLVEGGQQAIDEVARARYDLVLMDCHMPDVDGFQATRAIRQLPGPARSVQVVALTASAMPGDEARCLAAGMDGYLAKPVTLKALREALLRWMIDADWDGERFVPAQQSGSHP